MAHISVTAPLGETRSKRQPLLRKRHFGRSLIAKFILISAPIIMLCNVVFLHFYSDYRREIMLEELVTDVAAVTVRTAQALRTPLLKGDLVLGRTLIDGLAGHPEIICSEVWNASGRRVIAWPGLGCDRIEEEGILFTRDIKRRSGAIGKLRIEYRDTLVDEKLEKEILYIVVSLAFSAAVAFLFTIIAHVLTIGRPLSRLLSSIRTVAHAGEREPVTWNSRDELGTVIDAYNHMTEAEARRRTQLNEANEELKTEIVERVRAEEALKETQTQLIQASKMEALGTLAGGIAHEINTPIQYIGDNLRFLSEGFDDLKDLIDSYETVVQKAVKTDAIADELAALDEQKETSDAEYLFSEASDAARQSLDGVSHVSNIVLAMKEFAHPKAKEKTMVNLNAIVERATTVCRGEWKSNAELDLQLEETLPTVPGLEGELNQILLNLVVNASHAIGDAGKGDGLITVTTKSTDTGVLLEVRDNGSGIPEDVRDKIFDPFFTTKAVGSGSGQGLAICHDIIFNKHGGTIRVETEIGEGTVFIIDLPAQTAAEEETKAAAA